MEPELFGWYRLQELIGQGGMGEVYQAFDTRLKRVVAVKKLPAALGANHGFQARFRREAAFAARVQAPNIVPIHNYGDIDGQLFIDMQLIPGTDLGKLLTDHGPLPPSRAVQIIAHVAKALDAAHAQGLVHRDVKPSNVLLTKDDFAYLTDFGVARTLTAGNTLTSIGATVGTLAYVAPECFQGQPADHLSDIYALACMLFELLTGQPPFGREDRTLGHAHENHPPPLASHKRPDVPPALDEVIVRGMAKDPSKRYATAGELASAASAALRNVKSPGQDARRVPSDRGEPPPRRDGETYVPPPPSPPPPPPGHRWRLPGAAIALVIAAVATAFAILYWWNSPTIRLALSKSQVALRDTYFVTASGFAPGEKLRFSWTGRTSGEMGVFPADSVGSASAGPIFERDPLGNYTITVTGLTSKRTASKPLQVVTPTGTGTGPAAAQLQLSKDEVVLGDTYFATAWGFLPGEKLRFSWIGPTNGEMGIVTTDPNGSWSQGPISERHPPGTYTIAVTGLTSGRATSAQLNVVTGADPGEARLMLSSSQVATGDIYYATAWGFSPGENLRFSWTGPTDGVIDPVPTNSAGNTWIKILGNFSPGDYTVTVRGSTSARIASADLQVVRPGG